MPAIPTKLYEAFEKIRLGKVEEGTRLFDRVDGFEPVKAVALAELCYFRHDWKRGMLFAHDFFMADFQMESTPYRIPHYAENHLQVFLLATCVLDCWKESRFFLEEFKKRSEIISIELRKHCNISKAVSMVAAPKNTSQKFMKAKPRRRTEGNIELSDLENKLLSKKTRRDKVWHGHYCDYIADMASYAATEVHLAFYERYVDDLEMTTSHVQAAKSYIALENLREAKEAIRRYMPCWKFKEPFQVAPIELFTDPELWPVMSDRRFTESLLTIPHHRES